MLQPHHCKQKHKIKHKAMQSLYNGSSIGHAKEYNDFKEMGFHGRTPAQSLRSCSVGSSGVRHATNGLWSNGKVLFGEMNLVLLSGILMDEYGLGADARECYLPECIVHEEG